VRVGQHELDNTNHAYVHGGGSRYTTGDMVLSMGKPCALRPKSVRLRGPMEPIVGGGGVLLSKK